MLVQAIWDAAQEQLKQRADPGSRLQPEAGRGELDGGERDCGHNILCIEDAMCLDAGAGIAGGESRVARAWAGEGIGHNRPASRIRNIGGSQMGERGTEAVGR